MISLMSLSRSQECELIEIRGDDSLKQRLREMGLEPGARIRLVRYDDSHDLVELEFQTRQFVLHGREAEQVFVQPKDR